MSKKQKKIYKFDNNGIRKIKTLLNYEINPKIRKKIINHLVRKFKINFDFKKFYLSKTDIIKNSLADPIGQEKRINEQVNKMFGGINAATKQLQLETRKRNSNG